MTSHTAILARSFGIPAVLGIPGILGDVTDGMEAILDGIEGILITKPECRTAFALSGTSRRSSSAFRTMSVRSCPCSR